MVALGLGAVGVSLLGARPASAATAEPVRRVLILSLPNTVWRDLDAADLPNLTHLLDTAAVANLSTACAVARRRPRERVRDPGLGRQGGEHRERRRRRRLRRGRTVRHGDRGRGVRPPPRRAGRRRTGPPRHRWAHRGQPGEPVARAPRGFGRLPRGRGVLASRDRQRRRQRAPARRAHSPGVRGRAHGHRRHRTRRDRLARPPPAPT